MKKLYLIIILISIASSGFSDTVIQMEPYGGVFRIPCLVNGAKMKFIFDTGASDVCLSMTMAEYLLDNGYIDKEDILGTGSTTVADGRIIDHIKINLKDIEISGVHLYNIPAVVLDSQNAPLLIGQSVIQKLGSIEINGSLLVIKNELASDEDFIDDLFEQANQAYDDHLYGKAVVAYSKLHSMNMLSDYGLYYYARACFFNDETSKALNIINQVQDFNYFEERKIDIYRFMGLLNEELENYSDAISYYELSTKRIFRDMQDDAEKNEIFTNLAYEGDCYFHMDSYLSAADTYRKAATFYAMIHNVDFAYLQRDAKNQLNKKELSYRNEDIDRVLFRLFFCNERTGVWSTSEFLSEAKAMARAGNRYAMSICNFVGIDPYSSFW